VANVLTNKIYQNALIVLIHFVMMEQN